MFLNKPIFIIAEAGVNHNGDLSLAHKLIDTAADAGADAIKFQTFNADKLCTKDAMQANYQLKNSIASNQIEMLKKLELTNEEMKELATHAEDLKIKFLSTAFDKDSLDFLIEEIGMKMIKVPSGEITNYDFLDYVSKKNLPTIISTGASTIDEIHAAVIMVAEARNLNNSEKNFSELINRQTKSSEKIAILQCVSEYPADLNSANINVVNYYREKYNCGVGYSDHCKGISASIAAAANNVNVIEKHFTLDKNLPGPDHLASIDGSELKNMIDTIREVEVSLGSQDKVVEECEKNNRDLIRRSIVASKEIKLGEAFTTLNITAKRPAKGMSASSYFKILGTHASRDYKHDDLIDEIIQ
jgi:N-acetylneuraminate synthase